MSLSRRHFLKSGLQVGLGLATLGGLSSVASARVTQAISGQNWMGFLPDGVRLHQLTIPGTHDSGSLYGGALVKTQDLSIADQLRAGVRYLDVRICLRGGATGTFYVHHGIIYQHQTFTQVLETVDRFLKENPSETVMLCLKQENSSESDPVMGAAYQKHIQAFRDRVLDNGRLVSLGEARGKMVIVTRCLGIPGINYRKAEVLDNYSIKTKSQWYNEKWPMVKAFLYHVRQSPQNDERLWITTTSSVGAFLWPRSASHLMEPALKRYFETVNIDKPTRFGVVLVDFVNASSAGRLAALNFGRLAL